MSVVVLRSVGPVRFSASSIVARFELFVPHFAGTSADDVCNVLDKLLCPCAPVVSNGSITELMFC